MVGLNRARLWQVLSYLLETVGARKLALRSIEKAMGNSPENTDLHIQASRLFLKEGQLDQAAHHCKKASIGMGAGGFLCWLDKATCGKYLHKYNKIAKDDINKGTNCTGGQDYASKLNDKGLLLLEQQHFPEALACFKQALRFSKKDPIILLNIAMVHSKMKNYHESLKTLERVQRLGYCSLEVLMQKGYNLFHLKKYEEAVTCYEMARQMAPEDATVLGNLGSCYQRLGNYNQAVDSLKLAIGVNPQDATLYNNLALCLEQLDQLEEALHNYRQAVNLAGDNVIFMNNYAACLSRMGQHLEAITLCDQALQLQPDNHQAWGLKGNVLMELGKHRAAAQAFARALGLARTY